MPDDAATRRSAPAGTAGARVCVGAFAASAAVCLLLASTVGEQVAGALPGDPAPTLLGLAATAVPVTVAVTGLVLRATGRLSTRTARLVGAGAASLVGVNAAWLPGRGTTSADLLARRFGAGAPTVEQAAGAAAAGAVGVLAWVVLLVVGVVLATLTGRVPAGGPPPSHQLALVAVTGLLGWATTGALLL